MKLHKTSSSKNYKMNLNLFPTYSILLAFKSEIVFIIALSLQVFDRSRSFDDMEWFRGARLNYAENIFKYKDSHIALIATGELHKS